MNILTKWLIKKPKSSGEGTTMADIEVGRVILYDKSAEINSREISK